jgi:hypothetical protein
MVGLSFVTCNLSYELDHGKFGEKELAERLQEVADVLRLKAREVFTLEKA